MKKSMSHCGIDNVTSYGCIASLSAELIADAVADTSASSMMDFSE